MQKTSVQACQFMKAQEKDIQSWQYTCCFSSHSSSTPTSHTSYQCYWIDMGQN